MTHIAVIGAGQAGASLVARLRGQGFEGRITLLGAEPVPPYQRPPLSKKFLLGEMTQERLYLRPEAWYADNAITLRTDCPVTALHPEAQEIELADATRLTYDQLALTTGSRPRPLPAAPAGAYSNVFAIRTLADIHALAPHVVPGARVLIVGGGYIGLEAAAVAAQKGLQVTLIEAAPRLLGRVAAPETAAYFRALHMANGVTIREGCGLERLLGEGEGEERATGAVLSDGTHLDLDLVILGTGILPETTLAEGAGLALDNGIACDARGRTSDPHIWAAGDCASVPHGDSRLRLESVQNAIDMAECVADNMLGQTRDYDPHPWFWSDQYDVKLQIAGLSTGYDRLITRRDDRGARSHWYFAGDRLLAVDAMNDPRGYMVGKRLIEAGRTADPARITDPTTDLKELLRP